MKWDEWRGSLDGRPTMWIKRLLRLPFWRRAGEWRSLRVDLHKFVGRDDRGCFHTHPAYAVRIVLWGGYVEQVLCEECDRIRVISEGTRPPLHRHALSGGPTFMRRPGHIGLVRPDFTHRVAHLLNGRASYSLWLRGPICADVKLVGDGWPKQRGKVVAQYESHARRIA